MTDLRAERRAIAAQFFNDLRREFWQGVKDGEHDSDENWFHGVTMDAYKCADAIMQHDTDNPPAWEGEDYKSLYHELLYQVELKYLNESRHETAKRLIQNSQRCVPCNAIGGKELQN